MIPQATARLKLKPADLKDLPIGAKFESKQGNATATATITPDGNIEITANCDSLTILIEQLEIEVHHLREVNTALKTELNKKETVELSGWQHFQIKGFWLCIGLITIYITYKRIKRKWQKK